MFYNNYIEQDTVKLMMLSTITTKSSIKKVLKCVFSGFSIFFISILIFILVHDVMIGAFSQTSAEYCVKYGFLASPDCW
jgi:hypothetical protein